MSDPGSATVLIERDEEPALFRRLAVGRRAGRAAADECDGPPGLGRSTLLEDALELMAAKPSLGAESGLGRTRIVLTKGLFRLFTGELRIAIEYPWPAGRRMPARQRIDPVHPAGDVTQALSTCRVPRVTERARQRAGRGFDGAGRPLGCRARTAVPAFGGP